MKRNDELSTRDAMQALIAGSSTKEVAPVQSTDATDLREAHRYSAVELAEKLILNGYRPVPIPRGEKGPKIQRWNETVFGPDDFLPSLNIGVLTGQGVALLDVDVTDKAMVEPIVNEFIDRFEVRGAILTRTGLAPKVGIPIRAPFGIKKKVVRLIYGHQIEVLGLGQQFVAYGLHPAGHMYGWGEYGSLVDHRAEDLPELTEADIDRFLAWVSGAYSTPTMLQDAAVHAQAVSMARQDAAPDREIIDLLNRKCNTLAAGSYVDWRNIGFGARAKYRGTDLEAEAYDAFVAFSLRWENGTTERCDIDKLWNSEKHSEGRRIGPGTAIKTLRRLPSMFPNDAVAEPKETLHLPPVAEIGAQFTGLAKRLYQQLLIASDRQTSNIQLAGALATLSAVIGPSAVIQNGVKGKCCTNLYLLSLAKTGGGKETIRTLVSSALRAADRGSEVFDGAPSDVSFHAALSRLGGRLSMLIDEAGIIAKAVKAGANSHQRLLIASLMKTYGCGLTQLEARRYADRRKDIDAVDNPRPTVMMTSTVQDFSEGVSQEDSASGFFNRFLAFVDAEHIPIKPRHERPDNRAVVDFPDDILVALKRLSGVRVGPELPLRLPEIHVTLTDEALRLIEDFKFDEVERCLKVGGTRAETWTRAVENAQRVAGLLAVSDALMFEGFDLPEVTCEARHVDLALQIVRRGLIQLEEIAHMAGGRRSRIDELKDKVLRTLERRGGQATRTQINRAALRSVRKEERDGLLDAMVEDGEIRRSELQYDGKSGPKPEVFVLPSSAHNKSEDPTTG